MKSVITRAAVAGGFIVLVGGCTPIQLPTPPGTQLSANAAGPSAIRLGQTVSGKPAGRGGSVDYVIELAAGERFNAIVAPAVPAESRMTVTILRMTDRGSLERVADNTTTRAQLPVATPPLEVKENGSYVVRVSAVAGGLSTEPVPYRLTVKRLQVGTLALGSAVNGETGGRGDAVDYAVDVDPGEQFNAVLRPLDATAPRMSVWIFRRRDGGELELETDYTTKGGRSPVATRPLHASEKGSYVVRVQAAAGGLDQDPAPYALTVKRLQVGSLALGQTVTGEPTADGDAVDYAVELRAGEHFSALLTPLGASQDRMTMSVYRREPDTTLARIADETTRGGREPIETGPLHIAEKGSYVVRVHATAGGLSHRPMPYSLTLTRSAGRASR